MATYPSGLRGKSAKLLFIGSNPIVASITPENIVRLMYYVYVLLSLKDNKRYIGITENIALRVKQHNNGHVKSTKHRVPLNLIYSETFNSKSDVISRERFFKTGRDREVLNEILKNSIPITKL